MKYLFIMIFIIGLSSTSFGASSKVTLKPIRGENFQRTELLDCQTYSIEKFKGVHKQFFKTVCYYEGYFYNKGKEESVLIIVDENNIKIVK